MSDEASSSVGATHHHHHASPDEARPLTAAELAERRKKNRQTFNRKRGDLLEDLLRSVDILVYAQLSAIYYLDCSFFRFFLRALPHFVFLTPKPAFFPEHPADRPYIGSILGTNILCILLHLIYLPSSGGESTRGYLHGGLVMDFIGQQGGASRMHMLMLDLFLLCLQLTQLCAKTTKLKLKKGPVQVTTSGGREYSAAPTTQDIDSEERGVRRSEEQDGIEMQNLNPSGGASDSRPSHPEPDEASGRDQVVSSAAPTPQPADFQISNAFNSGQVMIGNFDVYATVRDQVILSKNAPREPPNLGRDVRANIAGQLLRWRFGGNVAARG
ncbi:hypothetical protein KC332_g10612 [Hortaea werneckii]|uniref:DUF1746 domain-containing protein n=2 Tax=Hortaea werneckii TaxID=91943 RepID=A0A3M7I713_HORWE|nr:hypothetical protein KC358_g11595 [Hortaea werneckii]OTA39352.1 hypothetical protein BTJ68_00714 [Hortaea werneckii EXF-2000]KAI6815500.1 hypothetical protein KC350_g11011 [Hortaea werneckii]KAI6915826.1 hypothetical protein KC348_g11833 [Hortaea werneckii]KAI6930178.1 hypothetical protein KC341_g10392 [Hortaea werneckii]